MIQKQSHLFVTDNSGARELLCLRSIPSTKKFASSGDIIIGVVKKALPMDSAIFTGLQKNNMPNSKTLIKKSEIVLSAIVRVKTFLNRDNGFFTSFDKNAAILLKTDKTPRGTRIFGPISKEVRNSKIAKIISLATEII